MQLLTVSSTYCAYALRVLSEAGASRAELLAAAGLAEPERWPERVPLAAFHGLLERAEDLLADPDALPFLVGRDTQPELFDVLGYLVSVAATVGDALASVVRFGRLVTDEPVSLVTTDELAQLVYEPLGPRRRAHRHMAAIVFVDVQHGLEKLTGQPLVLAWAVLPGGPPSPRLQEALGAADVREGWPPRLAFDVATLERPIQTANAPVFHYLEGIASERLELDAESLEARARRRVVTRLPQGTATLALVARDLAVSTRSLQRGLRASGWSFSALVEDVRRGLAQLHLEAGRKVAEVAVLTGYADARAFRRAYRRWHGVSPRGGKD